ncbi:MAG: SYNERG-CTERM sorting domain-containing protein [Synergistaceae bacterium]|jgi:Synergist-CTERM protein sorting domain-containing protein|nr:SYNERG-CTERM sorting domain-containing protein [Synergistaceae bacterium]
MRKFFVLALLAAIWISVGAAMSEAATHSPQDGAELENLFYGGTLGDGDVIELISDGDYKLSNSLEISGISLEIIGNNATIEPEPSSYSVYDAFLVDGGALRVENVIIMNYDPAYGFSITNGASVELRDVTLDNCVAGFYVEDSSLSLLGGTTIGASSTAIWYVGDSDISIERDVELRGKLIIDNPELSTAESIAQKIGEWFSPAPIPEAFANGEYSVLDYANSIDSGEIATAIADYNNALTGDAPGGYGDNDDRDGGGGCDAGLGALGLLAAPPIFLRRKKASGN